MTRFKILIGKFAQEFIIVLVSLVAFALVTVFAINREDFFASPNRIAELESEECECYECMKLQEEWE